MKAGSFNVIANPCTHWAAPTITWEDITLNKGILKEKPLSQVKNGGWSFKIYSLPEASFLLSEFGAVLTYIHKITNHCFPGAGIVQMEAKHQIIDGRESKIIVKKTHNCLDNTVPTWSNIPTQNWKRKQKLDVRVIILWPNGDS